MKPDIENILLDEYVKVVDIIQSYDSYFFKIKTWGVSLSGVVLSIGGAQHNVFVLLAALVLSVSFWVTESWYKMIQNGHTLRARELENAIQNKQDDVIYPRIFSAYMEKSEKNRTERKWLRMMCYSQVMYPHVFLVLLIISFLIKEM